jgi:hypothetical protein
MPFIRAMSAACYCGLVSGLGSRQLNKCCFIVVESSAINDRFALYEACPGFIASYPISFSGVVRIGTSGVSLYVVVDKQVTRIIA